MPQETIISKILSGLKRRGRKPQSRRKKIRLPFSGKMKAIASKLINSRIPDIEKLAPVEEQQITKPSFGIVAKDNPEYVVPAVKPKTNPKHIISATKPRSNSEYTIPSGKVFSKAFSRFEILMKKLNKSGKRFIPISRDDVNVLTKIIPAFRTGGMVTNPTPAVLGEGGPESVHEQNMRFLEAQGARTKEFATRTGRETVAMGQERERTMYDSGLSDVEKARRRVMDAGLRTSINVPEMLEDERYRRNVVGKPGMSDEKYERLLNLQAKKPKTEAEKKQQKQTVLTKKVDRLNERLQKVANNPRMPEDRKRKEMESIQRQINKTEFDLKKMTETEEERNAGLRETVKNLGLADPALSGMNSPVESNQESKSLPSPEKIIESESVTRRNPTENDSVSIPTLSTGSVSRNIPEQTIPSMLNSKNDSSQSSKSSVSQSSKSPVSYEGLSGIDLLTAGIQNEGEGEFSGKLDFSMTPKPDELQRTKPSIGNTPSTQGSSTSTSYKGLSGVELLKAGIENEGDGGGGLSIEPAMETSKIQEQVNEKMTTQKNNETMIKETMTRVDEKVGKAVSEGPQFIPIQTGNTSRTQKSGGSAQIISGDSSFKVASKDNMSHPIWRTRLG